VLGYTLLTELLAEPLRAARGRVLNVASRLAHSLDLDDVQFERRPYNGINAYAQSKQANRLWTWALARRLAGSGVSAHAMHPGGVRTGIFAKGGGFVGLLGALYGRLFGRSPEQGADTIVWLCGAPAAAATTGRFWVDRIDVCCELRDPATEDQLYELCRRMAPAHA
jgi:NAD(P)-dependent dehydrogenase (short-subunit alcohol dehydrogenase family)